MKSQIDTASLPSTLLPAVEKAAVLMDQELRLFKDFDIHVRWRGGRLGDGNAVVVCDLNAVDHSGELRGVDETFLPLFFTLNDEAAVRKTLREKLRRFVSILSEILDEDIERIRKKLAAMVPVGGE